MLNRNAAWVAASLSTAFHFAGLWLSSIGDGALRLEFFVAGILVPLLLLGYVAHRTKAHRVTNGQFGLGIGMFSLLPAGLLFQYLGPSGVDYYGGLGFLMVIFVLPIAAAGGALAILTWIYLTPSSKE